VFLLLVLFGLLYFLYKKFFTKKQKFDNDSSDSEASDDGEEDEVEEREFTLDELKQYNGKDRKEIYISVSGEGNFFHIFISSFEVFDVTDSGFYGPGQSYSMFAGKEIAMALAKHSTDEKYLNQLDLSGIVVFIIQCVNKLGLTFSEREELNATASHMSFKYTKVGWLKEWKELSSEKSESDKKTD